MNMTTEPKSPVAVRQEDSIYGAGPDTFRAKTHASPLANTMTGGSADQKRAIDAEDSILEVDLIQ